MMAPEKSELLRPRVVMRPSGVAPMKPVTTGTMPSSRSGSKNVAAALLGLFQMRLGVAEGVAGQDKIRGGNGNRGNAGAFERGGKEASAEAFAEGCEAVEELGIGGDG